MVRVCAFPNCGNKMRKWVSLSFHRLPLRCRDRNILLLWLVTLQLDVKTPLSVLREKDLRVCSEHFDESDFTDNSVKSRHLKKNVIPRAKGAAKVKVEMREKSPDLPKVKSRSMGIQVQPKTVTPPATAGQHLLKPPQYMVDEDAILDLLRICPVCNRKCRCMKHVRSPCLIVYQNCYFCDYRRKWTSQPEAPDTNSTAY